MKSTGVGLNPRFSYDTNNSLADGSQCRCSVVSNEIRSCLYQSTTNDRSSMIGYARQWQNCNGYLLSYSPWLKKNIANTFIESSYYSIVHIRRLILCPEGYKKKTLIVKGLFLTQYKFYESYSKTIL